MSDSNRTFDVAVIGGGAIGLAVGWRAAQRGLRVAVLERGEPGGGTSRVAAGMIAPVAEADPVERSLMAPQSGQRRACIRSSCTSSPRLLDATLAFCECGTLLAARDGDEAEALERELAMRDRLGLPVTRLRASEARAARAGAGAGAAAWRSRCR